MKTVLVEFGQYLQERSLHLEVTIIGGAALLIMGVIERATQDVDCLEPDLPEEILRDSREFAIGYKGPASPLREDWLNNGPRDLRNDLPSGWRARRELICESPGLTLRTLGRSDLLKSKLFAFCDRGQDQSDCLALAPTLPELREAVDWVTERDANSLWPAHVRGSFRALAERLGYEFEP